MKRNWGGGWRCGGGRGRGGGSGDGNGKVEAAWRWRREAAQVPREEAGRRVAWYWQRDAAWHAALDVQVCCVLFASYAVLHEYVQVRMGGCSAR